MPHHWFELMSYEDVDLPAVRTLTLVPFLADARVVLLDEQGRLALPTGGVESTEDPYQDAALRIPLEQAGFRRQGTHVLASAGDHLVVWIDGARYGGQRAHRPDAVWRVQSAAESAALMRQQGDETAASLIEMADHARLTMTDEAYAADTVRLLEPVYVTATTPEAGSGFGGSAQEWRDTRRILVDAIDADGTFLDVGCANGLLMETMVEWAAEKGHHLEPYGLELSAAIADLARQRLPRWADRIWVGDALTWTPPDGLRFDVVHALFDVSREQSHARLVRHLLDTTVRPGGRLLMSQYGSWLPGHAAADILSQLGYTVAGTTRLPGRGRHDDSASAWIAKASEKALR